MNDDDAIRDELARHLVEAFVHLHAETVGPAGLTDHEVFERIAPAVHLLDEARVQIVVRATAEHGVAFGAWVKGILERFAETEPPVSLERPRREEKE